MAETDKVEQAKKLREAVRFSETLSRPHSWMRKAEELLAAVSVLESEMRLFWDETKFENRRVVAQSTRQPVWDGHAILAAYALENLFKALLVSRNADDLKNRTMTNLPRYLKDHDLARLAQKVNFSLSIHEEDLLRRLSYNSEWAGRYPIPVKSADDTNVKKYNDGTFGFVALARQKDPLLLDGVVIRLRELLATEVGEDAA